MRQGELPYRLCHANGSVHKQIVGVCKKPRGKHAAPGGGLPLLLLQRIRRRGGGERLHCSGGLLPLVQAAAAWQCPRPPPAPALQLHRRGGGGGGGSGRQGQHVRVFPCCKVRALSLLPLGGEGGRVGEGGRAGRG